MGQGTVPVESRGGPSIGTSSLSSIRGSPSGGLVLLEDSILFHLDQDLRHMPYRLGLKMAGHHSEDRHGALAYSRKCISELVGPD